MICSTKSIGKKTWENAKLFRRIQIILNEFARLYSWNVFVPALIGGICAQVTLTYLTIDTIRSGHTSERWHIVVVGLYTTVLMAVVSIFLYGNQGRVFTSCVGANEEIVMCKKLILNRRFKRYFASCPELKVYFGHYNFFEPSTALEIQDITLDNTVSLLMF